MRRRTRFLLACLLALPVRPSSAEARVPGLLGYQGRLLRADGTAASGTASLTFAIYGATTGGSALWQESQTLGLSDGYYSTFLGLVAPPPDGLFDAASRWLEVRVGSETLVPRVQIGADPFAFTALNVRGGSADVTSLAIDGQTVIDPSGRLAGAARYAPGDGIAIDDAGRTVSLQACAAGQVLVRGATTWQCAEPAAGTLTGIEASAPLTVSGSAPAPQVSLPQAGSASSGFLSSTDWGAFNAKYGATTQCGGDLSGSLAAPTVARLQSRPIAATAPSVGQVLKWTGSQWEPAADANSGGTVTGITAVAPLTIWNGSSMPQVSIQQAGPGADGYLAATDWARFDAKYEASTQCVGDLAGTLASPVVAGIRGVSVATALPGASQVLRFDGTRWAPASLRIDDVGGLSSGYLGLTGDQSLAGSKTFATAPVFGTPLAAGSGGTGATDAAGARQSLGLGALATLGTVDDGNWGAAALSVAHGGTGATSPADARSGIGAAASGANSDITSLSGLTSALSVAQGGTGASSLAVNRLLSGGGTGPVSALAAGTQGQVLVSGGASAPTWQDMTSSQWTSGGGGISYTGGSVGIGTALPAYALDVSGTARLSGAVTTGALASPSMSTGSLSATGNATIGGTLDVTGATTVGALGAGAVTATSVAAGTLSGSGSGITALNASNLASGTVSDSLLTSNVARLNAAGTFSQSMSFGAGLTVPGGNVGVGTTAPEVNLDVAGSFKWQDVRHYRLARDYGSALGDWAELGSFANTSSSQFAEFHVQGHWCGSIISAKFRFDSTAYDSGGEGSTNWIELPVVDGGKVWQSSAQAVAVDVRRTDLNSTSNPILARLRNVATTCSSSVQNVDIVANTAFTETTGKGSGGTVDTGYMGSNVGWKFPVVQSGWSASTQGLFVQPGGNVGVGTTNPGSKLQVAGDVAVSGTVKGLNLQLTCETVSSGCTASTNFNVNCPAGYIATGSGWEPCSSWDNSTSHYVNIGTDSTSCHYYIGSLSTNWQGICTCCKVK